MPLKKTNTHKLGLVAKTVLSGLGAAAAVASDVAWNLLEQRDSKPSVSSNSLFGDTENGYGVNGSQFGYHIDGLLMLEDDEGNPL